MKLSRQRLTKFVLGKARYTKTLTLSGVGSDQTNYILPIMVHQGSARGSASGMDIFLDGHCKSNFSDVRFTDASGVPLSFYRAGYGNYELIPDNVNLKAANVINRICSNGMLLSATSGSHITRSSDNGANWTTIYTGSAAVSPTMIDSYGYLYVHDGPKVYRSTNWTGASPTFSLVLDLSADSTSYVDPRGATMDTNGDLYFSVYQTPFNPRIYKSTYAQAGTTWTQIFGYTVCPAWVGSTVYAVGATVRPTTANSHLYVCIVAGTSAMGEPTWPTASSATVVDGGVTWKESDLQHVHGLSVDPNTHYIYAGIDGSRPKLYRSIDAGTTWQAIRIVDDTDSVRMYFSATERLFSAGAGGACLGSAIMKTTDDVNFSIPLQMGASIQGLEKLGNTLYAATVTYGKFWYSEILRSLDEGTTWTTAWIGPYDSTAIQFCGYFYTLSAGTPTGDEQQIIFSPGGGGTSTVVTYLPLRAYEGGNHNQAVFYVNVASLPAAGTTIKVTYGPARATASNITIFPNRVLVTPPVHRWKFDEGTGITINDTGSAATPRPGVLTAGSGAWVASNLRQSGAFWPAIRQAGSYYNLNGSKVVITNSKADTTFDLSINSTLLTWIKSLPTDNGSNGTLFQKGHSSATTGYYLLQLILNQMSLVTKGTGGTTGTPLLYAWSPGDGQTHLVGYCTDASGKVAFVIDGHKLAYQTISTGIPAFDTTYDAIIGQNQSANRPYTGGISDVQIYNYELTQDQIRNIYEDRPIGTGESVIS